MTHIESGLPRDRTARLGEDGGGGGGELPACPHFTPPPAALDLGRQPLPVAGVPARCKGFVQGCARPYCV